LKEREKKRERERESKSESLFITRSETTSPVKTLLQKENDTIVKVNIKHKNEKKNNIKRKEKKRKCI